MKSNMRIKDGFVLRTVMGKHIIVAEGLRHKNFHKMISLNPSAAMLWTCAEGKDFTVQELANALVENYGIDIRQALDHASEIAGKWIKNGLVDA